jgi:phage terminase large subunit
MEVCGKTWRDLSNKNPRYIQLQGGTRSGKTWTTIQWLVMEAYKSPKALTIRMFRKYRTTAKDTIVADLERILYLVGRKYKVNRTDSTYYIGKSKICIDGCDNPQKLRGLFQDIAYLNEANELLLDDFDQINFRTTEFIIMDYNPSMRYHWLYDQYNQQAANVVKYVSTYLDNPFLDDPQIRAIESYQVTNPAKWRVYGLGETVTAEETIYPLWETFTEWPDRCKDRVFGLDFGMTVPSALVEASVSDMYMHVQEHLYQTNLSTSELIQRIKPIVGRAIVYCDAAEPDRIKELVGAGINAQKGIKDVNAGIAYIQGKQIRVHNGSHNLQDEFKGYSYRRSKATNEIMDEPVKANDHLLDAMRYAVYTHWGRPRGFKTGANPRNEIGAGGRID